jgi:hypothetical protein
MLRVENTSTDGNARGVVGLISSAAAAAGSAGLVGSTAATDPGSAGVIAQNTGGGPALKAVVNQGAVPFTVNSSTKVANLNADQLDGVSSNGFMHGRAANKVFTVDTWSYFNGQVCTYDIRMIVDP